MELVTLASERGIESPLKNVPVSTASHIGRNLQFCIGVYILFVAYKVRWADERLATVWALISFLIFRRCFGATDADFLRQRRFTA